MEQLTVSRVAELCGGTLHGALTDDRPIREIAIDTRVLKEGDLFAAFRGERVDGADYIQTAFERGAACCLAERVPDGETRPVIVVPDVLAALEKIAAAYRAQFDLPVIGITGSVGKTTAKEMISSVVEQRFRTLKTEGNLNNQIGIPMMLSRLKSSHEAAVIEMGISGFGEMRSLAHMVQPTMAVYTVIGHAHLEFLHDLDGVLKAKTEMLETLPETARVVVNGDDEKLREFSCRQRKITYGFGMHCDVRAENLQAGEQLCCDIVCGLRRIPVVIPAFGQHHVYAALAAAAVGMLLGLDDAEIAKGIAGFHNVGRRGELFHGNGFTMIDDSYNANPDSVDCGIDSLMRMAGERHICILGDMLELGENTMNMHYDVGRYAVEQGVDLVLTSGRCASEMSRAAEKRGMHFASSEELIRALPGIVKQGDCILVKASKGSHFETVAAALRELVPGGTENCAQPPEREERK
ncbi:MAG: UDP-N-acetylmuramoyl-tripeptide--D-alanyl-D-alanine ligase [Oscillospiraceae bacterium]|nr:UDP-N-acetylmuramoyl-tripeptide--D-alanyl-D-alanine ligase [Oscillospiraceae bacterium]